MQRVIVSVINDLSTDKRVHKTCISLHKNGYDVLLIGRKQSKSVELYPRAYKTVRMKLLFEKGVFFYAEYQLRLLFFLLFHKQSVLFANDLDTLLPNYICAVLKNKPLIYDTHELFCEVPELQGRPFKRKIWQSIEAYIFPKLKCVFTVNDSIASIYTKKYGVKVYPVRNVPVSYSNILSHVSKKNLGIAPNKKIILLQGAGINKQRGAEELVEAMVQINNTILLIIGGGDVLQDLKEKVNQLKLFDKVMFIPTLPLEKLQNYTSVADLGVTLDKDSNLNYKYSLPNKLFDYIHAGVPVLASDLPEVKKIINRFQVGIMIKSHNPLHIAHVINNVLADENKLLQWKANTIKAKQELNWENEEQEFIKHINSYIQAS
jgi:glycosyltransferase involved in cell wall biosynthesis